MIQEPSLHQKIILISLAIFTMLITALYTYSYQQELLPDYSALHNSCALFIFAPSVLLLRAIIKINQQAESFKPSVRKSYWLLILFILINTAVATPILYVFY